MAENIGLPLSLSYSHVMETGKIKSNLKETHIFKKVKIETFNYTHF